jgi:cyclophilin family peptidyl-prolyl cis-trans isomerase
MPQLVGRNCVICNQQINSALDAEFCTSCGNSVHRQCREDYQAPDDRSEPSRCRLCGGNPETAPVDRSRPVVTPEYWLYGLTAVVLLAVVGVLIWSSAKSPRDRASGAEEAQETGEVAADGSNPIVEIETTLGTIRAKLFRDKAPKTVENFLDLVKQGFYDDIVFHRVIKGFMIQTGDPLGNGTGGRTDKGLPEKTLLDEFHPDLRHDEPGVLSMANSGPNTGDTQFFITTVPTPWLDNKHSIFGQVVEGMDVVRKIENVRTDGRDRPLDEVKMVRVRMVGKD